MIPEAVNLYKDLSVKHETISLITPSFETPLPPLQSATFPPTMKELPLPNLDLFDLDEQFSSEK
jgi:intraflagellar transport protein 52